MESTKKLKAVEKAALKVLTQRRKCIEKYRATLARKRSSTKKKTVKARATKVPKTLTPFNLSNADYI
jgi:hypothetical protein